MQHHTSLGVSIFFFFFFFFFFFGGLRLGGLFLVQGYLISIAIDLER